MCALIGSPLALVASLHFDTFECSSWVELFWQLQHIRESSVLDEGHGREPQQSRQRGAPQKPFLGQLPARSTVCDLNVSCAIIFGLFRSPIHSQALATGWAPAISDEDISQELPARFEDFEAGVCDASHTVFRAHSLLSLLDKPFFPKAILTRSRRVHKSPKTSD